MVSTPVSFCDRSTWHLLSSRHHTEYSFRFQPGPLVWQTWCTFCGYRFGPRSQRTLAVPSSSPPCAECHVLHVPHTCLCTVYAVMDHVSDKLRGPTRHNTWAAMRQPARAAPAPLWSTREAMLHGKIHTVSHCRPNEQLLTES